PARSPASEEAAEPVRAEPVRAEPVRAEPVRAEPVRAAPVRRLSGYRSMRIAGVPHVRQRPDFGGVARAAMFLAGLGHALDQDAGFNQPGLDPELGRGCRTRELATAVTRIGFRVGAVWHTVSAERAESELESHFRELHADLLA